jgi:hypothetical protein
LAYITGSVDAVVAVVLGCYYYKARAENEIKLRQSNEPSTSEFESAVEPT